MIDYIINEGDPKEFKKDFKKFYRARITSKPENTTKADRLAEEIKKKYGLNEDQLSENFFYHMKNLT